mmetsp:Transcript_29/g.68  ORF Transcript_29/g.68 Transcript_29/m.68 type:complete len:244 (-) Transcript_29:321-1052(-)
MKIGLGVLREVVVHNHFHIINIQSSCGYIRCNKNVKMTSPKLTQCLLSLSLRDISMDSFAGQRPGQDCSNFIGSTLCLSEADRLAVLAMNLNQVRQDIKPRISCHLDCERVNSLCHLSCTLVSDQVDENRVVHILASQIIDPPWHGCAEKHVLAIRGEILVYLLHIFLKADVQHLVRLVEDCKAHIAQVEHSAVQHIYHSTRSTDDYIYSLVQFPLLLEDWSSTINADRPVKRCTLPYLSLNL